jgi:2-C-methyl-D-erythritol 4-phosphate cytidylyltransferase
MIDQPPAAKADIIIVAAGSGLRFGKQKQLASLAGRSLYLHSVDCFLKHPLVGRIVIVVSEELKPIIASTINERIEIVDGGATRQESVLNGIRALSLKPQSDIILVHDAARPCVGERVISEVIIACEEYDAALAALPVTDTIKRAEKELAVSTIPREGLWRAQTPQGARKELLIKAYETAEQENFIATDEAQLLERIGVFPKLVVGDEMNLKVTYPEDLTRLELYLSGISA